MALEELRMVFMKLPSCQLLQWNRTCLDGCLPCSRRLRRCRRSGRHSCCLPSLELLCRHAGILALLRLPMLTHALAVLLHSGCAWGGGWQRDGHLLL